MGFSDFLRIFGFLKKLNSSSHQQTTRILSKKFFPDKLFPKDGKLKKWLQFNFRTSAPGFFESSVGPPFHVEKLVRFSRKNIHSNLANIDCKWKARVQSWCGTICLTHLLYFSPIGFLVFKSIPFKRTTDFGVDIYESLIIRMQEDHWKLA